MPSTTHVITAPDHNHDALQVSDMGEGCIVLSTESETLALTVNQLKKALQALAIRYPSLAG